MHIKIIDELQYHLFYVLYVVASALYFLRSKLQVLQSKTPAGTLLPFSVDGGINFAEIALTIMKVYGAYLPSLHVLSNIPTTSWMVFISGGNFW